MPFPRWLSWLILLFLGYILVVGNSAPDRAAPPPPAASDSASAPQADAAPTIAADSLLPPATPKLQALVDGKRWARAIYPDYVDPDDACAPTPAADKKLGNYAIITREGKGSIAPVACGDSVTFNIERFDRAGKSVSYATSTSWELGAHVGLDALLVGMRPNEKRLLIFTPSQSLKLVPTQPPLAANTTHVMFVELLEVVSD